MNDAEFEARNAQLIERMGRDERFARRTREWFDHASRYEYSYHFRWLGLPIIQFPQDMVAVQEIIWRTRPDVIIETGIARGGSLIFSASMLELLGGTGEVIGIDIDIREENRKAIESHPLFKRITLLEGSSTDDAIVEQVCRRCQDGTGADFQGRGRVMVMLDSNHTADHVARELELYSPLVTPGCYLIVFDTVIALMNDALSADRPWDRQRNNPLAAVREFLEGNDRFEVDRKIQDKLQITVAPEGYLQCREP